MLDEVRWDDLLHVYQCTDWREGEDARVTIKDERIAELFHLVENSEKAEADANLAAIHPEDVVVGQVIDARVGAPRLALGILAKDWDLFLRAPNTRVREPSRYFVVEDRSHNGMEPPSERLKQYRAIVKLVGLLERAALFLDLQHQLLVYFKDQKIEVPVFFSTEDLGSIDQDSVELLDKALHVT